MAPTATLESFQAELTRLGAHFQRDLSHFESGTYNEASLRQQFLDPLFRSLGWDVGNLKGLIHTEREVDIEVSTATAGTKTRADYVFRVARIERFTCEAKKPSEILHNGHIYQAKRDAWARGIPFAILSDFEELKVYVVSSRPSRDNPKEGEYLTLHHSQYLGAARQLWDLLAYENVAGGCLDRLIDALPKRTLRGRAKQGWLFRPERTQSLDAEFLNLLDDNRQRLGSDLLKNNDRDDLLAGNHLNEAAQRIIDRLVFLRICEDRGIDTGSLLTSILSGWWRERAATERPRLSRGDLDRRESQQDLPLTKGRPRTLDDEPPAPRYAPPADGSLYRILVSHIRALDQRPPNYKPFFNGQLFKPHFSEDLVVGDEWLANFLDDLTDHDNGYNFADIKVEILGSAYERFLGKVLRPQGRGATIEEKPEVRKAGGVYYTPRYIVDYIVEQTVGRQLEGKTPAQAAKLRFLDPACGSGSFLIRVYERVMEHYLRVFTERVREFAERAKLTNEPLDKLLRPHRDDYYLDAAANVRLTTRLKRQILQNNVFGTDIDAQAVEVTQLSLYLKMLEGENRESLHLQSNDLFSKEALLPALDQNIKCGNSLIASDFSLDPAELVRVNAFDWDIGFEKIMAKGGFDAVVGNPPYVRIQTLNESDPRSVEYLGQHYRSAAAGNYDLYVTFIERALGLLHPSGRFGYIVPHKFFNAKYGSALRELLATGGHISGVVHFGHQQIFDGATTYTCLLFLTKNRQDQFRFTSADDLSKWRSAPENAVSMISATRLGKGDWVFSGGAKGALLDRLQALPVKLETVTTRIFQGIKTSADKIYIVEERSRTKSSVTVWSPQLECEVQLEPNLLHPLIKGGDSRRYSLERTERLILFPYAKTGEAAALLDADTLSKRYPLTWAYLNLNRTYLENREDGKLRGPKWYSYGRSQALDVMPLPKIFTPDIAPEPAFSYDVTGECFFTGGVSGGYGLLPQEGVQPEVLLALLNSRLLGWVIAQTATQMRGGYFSFESRFIRGLPIVLPEKNTGVLVSFVEKMTTLKPKLRTAKSDTERAALQNAIRKTDRDIDKLVYELYGLTPEEIALVEGTAETPDAEPAATEA